MSINQSNITLVLSGGSYNSNPSSSIGGPPSTTTIVSNQLNNLFTDVTPDQALHGYDAYRCLYFFNDSDLVVYNFQIWLGGTLSQGSTEQIGIATANEVQRIGFTGESVTGGSFTLSYQNISFTSNYTTNFSTWATNIQNSLNSIKDSNGNDLLRETTVTVYSDTTHLFFDVTFLGQDGKKSHELLEITQNNLTPTTTGVVSRLVSGGPINTIPSSIGVETTVPGNVVFDYYPSGNPIVIPKLGIGEGFPFWIHRHTPSGTKQTAIDGFNLQAKLQTSNPLG